MSGYGEIVTPRPLLVAYYHLESNGNDSSGSGFNLTGSGTPTYVKGRFTNCANFIKSSSQYLSSTSYDGITRTTDHTIGAWFSPHLTPASGKQSGIIGHGYATEHWRSNLLYDNNGGTTRIEYSFSVNGSPADMHVYYNIALTLDAWYHVVGVYDYTNKKMWIYVNGAPCGGPVTILTDYSGAAAEGSGIVVGSLWVLGVPNYSSNYYCDGRVDEAFIDKKVWTAVDVRNYYSNATGYKGLKVI